MQLEQSCMAVAVLYEDFAVRCEDVNNSFI